MNVAIRLERPGDENAVAEVTRQALKSHPYSHQTEHFIIEALRKVGALSLSLVAEQAGRIVGHKAAFLLASHFMSRLKRRAKVRLNHPRDSDVSGPSV